MRRLPDSYAVEMLAEWVAESWLARLRAALKLRPPAVSTSPPATAPTSEDAPRAYYANYDAHQVSVPGGDPVVSH